MARKPWKPNQLKKLLSISLREDITRMGKASAVDKERGIIRGCKILGLDSVNGRRYTFQAITEARKLYEGMVVNIDHPTKPGESRSAFDRLGKFVNVEIRPDGLYADLEFLQTHPLSARLCEAAERMPDVFGFSHNANGEGENDKDGIFVIHRITEVRSVDLVADPATTQGLFEARKPMSKNKIKVRTFLQEKVAPLLTEDNKKRLKKLLEGGDDFGEDDEMEDDDQAAAPDHTDHLLNAVAALVKSDDPGARDKINAIMKILTPAKTEDDDDAEEDDADNDASEDDDDASESDDKDAASDPKGDLKKQTGESRQAKKIAKRANGRVAVLERKLRVRELCDEAEVAADKVLLEALYSAKDDAAVKRLIDREKAQAGKRRPGVRSSAGKPVLEHAGAGAGDKNGLPEKAADQIAFLRG